MRNPFRVFLVATLVLVGGGCRKAGQVPDSQLLYVDSAEAPARVAAGQEVVVAIDGQKPDPAWQWLRNDIVREGSEITVSVVGERDPKKYAVQLLVPFSTTATLSALPEGEWSIVVRGRGKRFPLKVRVGS